MDFITLLAVIALLLIATTITRGDRHPAVMAAGLTLLFVSLTIRLFSGAGFFATVIPVFTDLGLSLMLASGWMALRKARSDAQPFFFLGLLALGVAGITSLGQHLFFNAETDPTEISTEAATEMTSETRASFLLELGPDDQIEEVASILSSFGATYERAFPAFTLAMDPDLAQVYLIYGNPAQFEALMNALREDLENVDFVEANLTVSLSPPDQALRDGSSVSRMFLEDDPLVAQQWGLEAIRGHEAHALLQNMTPTKKALVAIVDTGIDQQHEDVQGVFRQSPGATDGNGHGSHCAGIAGAKTNNKLGIASLNWNGAFVEVAGYQALGANGSGTVESIAQAILDAARDEADVISLSLGMVAELPPRVLLNAVAYAQRQGAIMVASAGNSNRDAYNHFPSNIEGVIAVSAVDQHLKKARFSNTNTSLKRPLAAPGVDILSFKPNNDYVAMSGTSMAAPMVSGLLGILRSLDPNLSAERAYDILHQTGLVVEDSDKVGRVINAEAAIRTLAGPQ